MDKKQLDELYHNLRVLCVTGDLPQKDAVAGIVSHLTRPQGDYTGLLRFLDYYGGEYILPHVVKLLSSHEHKLRFTRVVDIGAGFCWLGRGISNAFGQMPALFIDKRQWPLIDTVADIEAKNGAKRVLEELRHGDLIAMSELLHCLGNPQEALRPFSPWPVLIVEYMTKNTQYYKSYNAQIKKFGCVPPMNIKDIFPTSTVYAEIADPYMVWLAVP